MEEKTEYRIIPYKTFIGDMYLQFKDTQTRKRLFRKPVEETIWRFIPEEMPSIVFGRHLDKESCPTSLFWGDESRFLHCFHGQENYDIGGVAWFAKKYPNIQEYFDYLKIKRDEYLQRQEDKNNAKAIYL